MHKLFGLFLNETKNHRCVSQFFMRLSFDFLLLYNDNCSKIKIINSRSRVNDCTLISVEL